MSRPRCLVFLAALVFAVTTLAACAGGGGSSAERPPTDARLEIVDPAPNATVGRNFTLNLRLADARVVPAEVTKGPLRGDEGHIHVTLDGKLVSMTYGTSQEMKDIPPGPHNLQAEFVATDHAPFANRVIVAVAFQVADQGSAG